MLHCSFKFGDDFDWGRGGQLPGLCGGDCATNCHRTSGLDGFIAQPMWRPCVWPPRHSLDSFNCVGGKLAASVHAAEPGGICGADFDFEHPRFAQQFTSRKKEVVAASFFQPAAEAWYTVWSHVAMNSAGARSCKRAGVYHT